MLTGLKKVVKGWKATAERGGRKTKERCPEPQEQQRDPPLRLTPYVSDYRDPGHGKPAWPIYDPAKWPTKYHHKCDVEWCGFANYPKGVAGDYRCGYWDCVGVFNVSPELAATIAVKLVKIGCFKETMATVDDAGNTLLHSSGRSAMECRRRPRVPSHSSFATAPHLVRFPPQRDAQHQSSDSELSGDSEQYENSLHPKARSSLRGPRRPIPAWGASLQRNEAQALARAPGQRLASQPQPARPLNIFFGSSPL